VDGHQAALSFEDIFAEEGTVSFQLRKSGRIGLAAGGRRGKKLQWREDRFPTGEP
jgi:hypothetical protein